ncbi:hypothetical protein [Ehrlichia canis]|uniref:hypothetical protein n=1 Tax=Ehrlichia canis TaxID=944 RepID=UPI001F38B869|nr:hypothetical protein [Ehrlichia canis]UKC53664.1 hypothetical protein s20019040002_000707 [Ehrlichia canis]UKC54602.1 hypothetical protein s20026770001_000708 [Ehrlichia canis]UKC55538.1 hypothetical protein s21009500007_000708 [Ehrlichia canis]
MDTTAIVLLVLLIVMLLLLVLLAVAAVKCQKQYNFLKEENKKLLACCEEASDYSQELVSQNDKLKKESERIKSKSDKLERELKNKMQKFFSDQVSEYEDLKESCIELINIRGESVKKLFDDVKQDMSPESVKCLIDTNILFLQKSITYEIDSSKNTLEKRLSDQFISFK